MHLCDSEPYKAYKCTGFLGCFWAFYHHYTTEILHYTTEILHYTTEILHYTTEILHYTTEILHYTTEILRRCSSKLSINVSSVSTANVELEKCKPTTAAKIWHQFEKAEVRNNVKSESHHDALLESKT